MIAQVWAFIQAHSVVLLAFGVAVIDFVWALAPSLKANGLLHALYLLLGGKETPPAQP